MFLHNQPSTFEPDCNKKFECDWANFIQLNHLDDQWAMDIGSFDSLQNLMNSAVGGFGQVGAFIAILKDRDNDYIIVDLTIGEWIPGQAIFNDLASAVYAAVQDYMASLDHHSVMYPDEVDAVQAEIAYLESNYL